MQTRRPASGRSVEGVSKQRHAMKYPNQTADTQQAQTHSTAAALRCCLRCTARGVRAGARPWLWSGLQRSPLHTVTMHVCATVRQPTVLRLGCAVDETERLTQHVHNGLELLHLVARVRGLACEPCPYYRWVRTCAVWRASAARSVSKSLAALSNCVCVHVNEAVCMQHRTNRDCRLLGLLDLVLLRVLR
jgi:hypothetical protein